jgi:hypothetical protein
MLMGMEEEGLIQLDDSRSCVRSLLGTEVGLKMLGLHGAQTLTVPLLSSSLVSQ